MRGHGEEEKREEKKKERKSPPNVWPVLSSPRKKAKVSTPLSKSVPAFGNRHGREKKRGRGGGEKSHVLDEDQF